MRFFSVPNHSLVVVLLVRGFQVAVVIAPGIVAASILLFGEDYLGR